MKPLRITVRVRKSGTLYVASAVCRGTRFVSGLFTTAVGARIAVLGIVQAALAADVLGASGRFA